MSKIGLIFVNECGNAGMQEYRKAGMRELLGLAYGGLSGFLVGFQTDPDFSFKLKAGHDCIGGDQDPVGIEFVDFAFDGEPACVLVMFKVGAELFPGILQAIADGQDKVGRQFLHQSRMEHPGGCFYQGIACGDLEVEI